MQEINIIEVPKENVDEGLQLCFSLRAEKYYFAHETDIHTPKSVLFSDLLWLRKHFGDDLHEGSIITKESLNVGRKREIARIERALKLNVRLYELSKFDENDEVRINPITKEPYQKFDKLDQADRQYLQNNVDSGLFVLCKLM